MTALREKAKLVLFTMAWGPVVFFFAIYFWLWSVFQPKRCDEFWKDVEDPYR